MEPDGVALHAAEGRLPVLVHVDLGQGAHLAGRGIVAALLQPLPIALQVGPHLVCRRDARVDEEVSPPQTRLAEALRADGGHPEGRMRLLHRPQTHRYVPQVVEAPLEVHPALPPGL